MSFDFTTEKMLSFKEASKLVPRNPHVSTLRRWWNRGVRGVRLETVLIGGKRCTSIEATNRFFDAIAAKDSGERVSTPSSNTMKASSRVLDEAGI